MTERRKDMSKLVIAIDGPAASGKSTTAKLVAEKLGMLYLDTGAMYRAVTLKATRLGYEPEDSSRIAAMTAKTNLEFKIIDGKQRIMLDGEDVSGAIRTPDVTTAVSPVAAHAEVRKILVDWQKAIGAVGGVVAEGRDTTSVVFPDADLKIFLSAKLSVRARRRVQDMESMGLQTDQEEQEIRIAKRDDFDSSREASPLTKVPEAYEVDTTNLTIDEQVQKIIELATEVSNN